ncbi:MAG TPA: aspartate/glutamate racemase family protein [Hyphomicrobiaceae bacterium]|nr:aspartate/glutamate racemase family protein [Hyphomicrobiaceae bacterium]
MRILYQLTSPMQHTLGAGEIARRQLILAAHAAAGTEVAVEPTDSGPAAIESARDAGLIVPELIRLGPRAEQRGFAALIIGCYSDPGLDALRELVAIPVVGPGAAALHLAAQLGTRIGILTPRDRGLGRVAARLRALGLAQLLAGVRGIGLSVIELARQEPGALEAAAAAARLAVHEDGADVLVLGCMSMAFLPDVTRRLGAEVGVPVVNPVIAALKTAEALAAMALAHSKRAWPVPKPPAARTVA